MPRILRTSCTHQTAHLLRHGGFIRRAERRSAPPTCEQSRIPGQARSLCRLWRPRRSFDSLSVFVRRKAEIEIRACPESRSAISRSSLPGGCNRTAEFDGRALGFPPRAGQARRSRIVPLLRVQECIAYVLGATSAGKKDSHGRTRKACAHSCPWVPAERRRGEAVCARRRPDRRPGTSLPRATARRPLTTAPALALVGNLDSPRARRDSGIPWNAFLLSTPSTATSRRAARRKRPRRYQVVAANVPAKADWAQHSAGCLSRDRSGFSGISRRACRAMRTGHRPVLSHGEDAKRSTVRRLSNRAQLTCFPRDEALHRASRDISIIARRAVG